MSGHIRWYTRQDSKKSEKQGEVGRLDARYALEYASGCQWGQIRQLIEECPNLPLDVRQSLVAQGDEAASRPGSLQDQQR